MRRAAHLVLWLMLGALTLLSLFLPVIIKGTLDLSQ